MVRGGEFASGSGRVGWESDESYGSPRAVRGDESVSAKWEKPGLGSDEGGRGDRGGERW